MARKLPWQDENGKDKTTPKKIKRSSTSTPTPAKSTKGQTSARDISLYFKSPRQAETISFSSSDSAIKGRARSNSPDGRPNILATDEDPTAATALLLPPSTPSRKRKRDVSHNNNSNNRSPSSSPPPIHSPNFFSPMRTGRDKNNNNNNDNDLNDDMYIMVEDEFQAVAQSYTAHLHQAEYKRLVKLARERSPKPLPEETLEELSVSRRLQLDREKRGKKLEKGLDALLGTTAPLYGATNHGVRRDTTTKRGREKGKATADPSNPWKGTSLETLMSPSKIRQNVSLVGLENIPSSTRASLGFQSCIDTAKTKDSNRHDTSVFGEISRDSTTTSTTTHGSTRTTLKTHRAKEPNGDDSYQNTSITTTPALDKIPSTSPVRFTHRDRLSHEPSNKASSSTTYSSSANGKRSTGLQPPLRRRRRKVFDDGFDESLVQENDNDNDNDDDDGDVQHKTVRRSSNGESSDHGLKAVGVGVGGSGIQSKPQSATGLGRDRGFGSSERSTKIKIEPGNADQHKKRIVTSQIPMFL